MEETSTTTLHVTEDAAMREQDVTEIMDADELVFYRSIRADLDQLRRVPKKQTIDNILSFSQSLR